MKGIRKTTTMNHHFLKKDQINAAGRYNVTALRPMLVIVLPPICEGVLQGLSLSLRLV